MQHSAIVVANGRYRTPNAKPAHGLVRGSERFAVRCVVDASCAGSDAGTLLDGVARGIPVVADLAQALAVGTPPATHCVVGVATHGGRLDAELRDFMLSAAGHGLSLVNGLHDFLADDAEISAAAAAHGGEIIDVRKPRPRHTLHFWEGEVKRLRALRIAVLGTDCALGKRTTARLLVGALNDAGISAQMIYTGQTGWMQGARYGFVLDSTVNDYVSGELEHALVSCEREAAPRVMVIEGQSALRNPSGPCGAELLLSGMVHGVVLQHAPGREYFEGYEAQALRIPTLGSEIELIAMYGVPTVAVAVNGEGLDEPALVAWQREHAARLRMPVVAPLHEGVGALVECLRGLLAMRGEHDSLQ